MAENVRVTHGVWREAAAVADLPGQVAAALTACPADAVICGLTAARLHGLWVPAAADRPIEAVVRAGPIAPTLRAASRRAEIRLRRRAIRSDEIVWVGGIPCTSVARTWADLAETLPPPDLVAVGDSALRGADATLGELSEMVSRAIHRRGVVRARALLPMLDGRARSRPESHLRYAIVSAGLPCPEVNKPIHSATGEWIFEPDLSYEDVRLALEYNGAFHADPRRMRRDISRALDAVRRDSWQTVTFGPAEVFGRPDEVALIVGQLRRALRPRR